jgi:hypothetical protein
MTFQEVMDSLFYGKLLTIEVPKIAASGSTISVNLGIRGNSFFEKAELYQNGILISTLTPDDF